METDFRAVITGAGNIPYFVLSAQGDTLAAGRSGPEMLWDATGQWASALVLSGWASEPQEPARLVVPGIGETLIPRVSKNADQMITATLARSFYFQRCSKAIQGSFAGQWRREAGHPDTEVKVHLSATTESRKEGTTLRLPGGWYDAGDYGKYCGPTAFATWSFLHLLEANPAMRTLQVNIPESENELPDLLDEGLVGVRFLLAAQAEDGSVPHKLTAIRHASIVMPAQDKDTRYLIGLSAPTTFTFAAAMAKASRICAEYSAELPGLADSCLAASVKAFDWAMQHQEVTFRNPTGIHTGEYKDLVVEDEREWARLELWITTGDRQYRKPEALYEIVETRNPFHGDATWKAMLSLTLHQRLLGASEKKQWRDQLTWRSNRMKEYARFNPYGVPLGFNAYDFNWGSNAILARQGIWWAMTAAWTRNQAWLHRSHHVGEYLLGMNPLDLCFITGLGERSPTNIHHRPSFADGVPEPIPGLMVAGPQSVVRQQDCESYPSELPALRYADEWCSYTTNEIAINWNATAMLFFGLGSQ